MFGQKNNDMSESFFDKLPVSAFQIRVFIGTFICMFIVVVLQHLGVQVPRIADYINQATTHTNTADVFDSIKAKLGEKIHAYSLKKDISLIKSAVAGGEYEQASAYVVIEFETGNVIAEKNLDEPVAIASLTKIMTAMTALDLAEPDERFTVTEQAAKKIPTKIGIIPGQQLTLEELLYASLLTSANDATEVIREGVDKKYGKSVFMRAMNENARVLGLTHTHFTNPQGFDTEGNYSSAADQAVLTHYVLSHYPLIAKIVTKEKHVLSADGHHSEYSLYNWNGLLGVYPAILGVKIGNTADAGKTTVVVSEREGKKILVVLLGAPGVLERDLWSSQLLDLGYKKTLGINEIGLTEERLREKYATWNYRT